MRVGLVVLSLVVAGPLAGCPDRSISEVEPQQGRVIPKSLAVKVNRDLDLLFLIDNSPSMADKQINLVANFPTFIQVLGEIEGGLPNVHIGVVTSDLGTQGAADAAPGPAVGKDKGSCSGVGDAGHLTLGGVVTTTGEPYLIDVQTADDPSAPRTTNFAGTSDDALAAAFAKMAVVGTDGCGFEQHLEAVKRALDPSNTANRGFLRDDALLAVIIIADEDDCSMAHSSLLAPDSADPGVPRSFRCTRYGVSCDDGGQTPDAMNQLGSKHACHPNDDSPFLTKVSGYATFLKSLKTDPRKVVVAGIIGPSDPVTVVLPDLKAVFPALAHTCMYVGGDNKTEVADPAVRIKSLLDQFPGQNTFATICQQDLSGPLQQIAQLIKTASNDPCIDGKLAHPPDYECAVSAIVAPDTASETEQVLPRCDATASNQPCWHIVADATKCSSEEFEHHLLQIEGQNQLQVDTHIVANCVVE